MNQNTVKRSSLRINMRQPLKLPCHMKELLTNDDVESLKYLRMSCARVYGDEGMNLLHLSARYSLGTHIAMYCIKTLGICPKLQTKRKGNRPLHYAAAQGNLALVIYLVNTCSAGGERLNKELLSPLYFAVRQNHSEVVQFLVQHTTQLCDVNKHRWNMVHWAAKHGNLSIVKLLVRKGVDHTATTWHRENALHLAAWSGNLLLVQFMVQQCTLPFATDVGSFFMYLKGNWSVVDWVLRATSWVGVSKLPTLLNIEAPAGLITQHCTNSLNIELLLSHDRADVLKRIYLNGELLLGVLSKSRLLGANCAKLLKELVSWREKLPSLLIHHELKKSHIGRLPVSLLRELMGYLVNNLTL